MTLIEITVAMAILLVITIMAGDYITTGLRGSVFADEQEKAVKNGYKALNNIALDLREARRSEQGAYPLAEAESQNFVWYGDIDNDSQSEKIRYLLENNNLIRVVTEPGAGIDYKGAVATTTIAEYVNNQTEPIFYYFDSNNTETDIINAIRMVNIILKINVTPEKAPADYYVETNINLRNLKDNL